MASQPKSCVIRFSLTLVDNRLILTSTMAEQSTINYDAMFADLLRRHNALILQRNEIDIEISKLKQLILATAPLLPEHKQKMIQTEIEELEEQSASLLDAIKLVFSARKEEWLTASEVRDYLMEMGIDFRQYKTNPLASIATTLKRMVPTYLESKTSVQTGTNYKRRKTIGDRIAEGFDRIATPLPGSPGVTLPNQDDIARQRAQEGKAPIPPQRLGKTVMPKN
jgi:hypothetical protein